MLRVAMANSIDSWSSWQLHILIHLGCVDDFSARALGCDLMVHYGHSCLIPIDRTSNIKMLYVFVSISIDPVHFIESIVANFASLGNVDNANFNPLNFAGNASH